MLVGHSYSYLVSRLLPAYHFGGRSKGQAISDFACAPNQGMPSLVFVPCDRPLNAPPLVSSLPTLFLFLCTWNNIRHMKIA